MVGKWHLCPEDEMNLASTGGSGRSGGASSGSTASSAPRPTSGIPTWCTTTIRSSSRRRPEEGYHFSVDITDRALAFIRDAKAVAPDKPFLLYYCPGACHAPHHAPTEWSDRYRRQVRHGLRGLPGAGLPATEGRGLLSEHAELSPINPYVDRTSKDGKSWPELDTVRPWESLD